MRPCFLGAIWRRIAPRRNARICRGRPARKLGRWRKYIYLIEKSRRRRQRIKHHVWLKAACVAEMAENEAAVAKNASAGRMAPGRQWPRAGGVVTPKRHFSARSRA